MDNKIALLRGINVGGKKKILMADLKELFIQLGCKQVKTYIQSGNVLFESIEDNSQLADQIIIAIQKKFDFDVPVILLSKAELIEAYTSNPFLSENIEMGKLHLTFLKEQPTAEAIEQLKSMDLKQDRFEIIAKNLYIHCEGKFHKTKLTSAVIERKLNTQTTTRNWKTVTKLVELCQNHGE
nr:DUF1697 domain-containing protein [uncultured Brumimicrobium sp.]